MQLHHKFVDIGFIESNTFILVKINLKIMDLTVGYTKYVVGINIII